MDNSKWQEWVWQKKRDMTVIPTNFDQFVFPCQFPQPSGWGPWLVIFPCQSFFFSTSATNNRYDLPMSVVNLASRSHNHPVQGTAICASVGVIGMIAGKYSHNWQNCSGFGFTRWLESKCAGLIFIKQSQRGFHWPMTKDRYRETPSVMVCQKKLTRDDISWYLWECISWASLD